MPERGFYGVVSFEHGVLVATRDAHLYNPSKLHPRYLRPDYNTVQLITQRSANDIFAYGRWSNRTLIRSISVNTIYGRAKPSDEPAGA